VIVSGRMERRDRRRDVAQEQAFILPPRARRATR